MTVYAEWWWRGVPKEKDRKNMSDYISREKAIDTADTMLKRCDTESIEDYHDMMVESLSVLPSVQQKSFRVIDKQTGKEADPYDIALTEEWAKGLIYCDMEGFAILEDGTLMLTDECGRYEFCPEGRFEVIWNG